MISVRPYYHKDLIGNFGDDLNAPLWRFFLPEFVKWRAPNRLVGIGTLLNNRVPAASRYYVMGSGVGYGSGLPTLDERWRFYCVRGPLTARRLGLPDWLTVTDPAVLVRRIISVRSANERKGVLLVPHHHSALLADWATVANRAGFSYLDPSIDGLRAAKAIASARLVITEAMHGAILADSLRTPWVAFRSGAHILEAKWRDWSESVKLQYRAVPVSPLCDDHIMQPIQRVRLSMRASWRARHPVNYVHPNPSMPRHSPAAFDAAVDAIRECSETEAQLSDDTVIQQLEHSLMERLKMLRSDLISGGHEGYIPTTPPKQGSASTEPAPLH